jgi:choline monooxygenase
MRREPLDIDPDIRKARTLPAWFYRSQEVHGWLAEQLFARSWQLVSHLRQIGPLVGGAGGPEGEQIGESGAWPFRFLPGIVDEPLLLTRDEHGAVRCLSNVCTHRAATIVRAPCTKLAALRCPYHGRRFALDGRMLAMPEFEGAEEFPSETDNLPQLPLLGLGEFLFTALDPAWPFAELVELVTELAGHLPWDQAELEPRGTTVYEFDANWMLYLDNYLEGFHVPYVHPALAKTLEFDSYTSRLGRWSNVQIALPKPGEPAIPLPEDAPADAIAPAALYFYLFPNTMRNVYPWGVSLNIVEPLALARTRVRYEAWVWAPELYDKGAGSGLAQVEREDQEVVLRAQAGVRSRLYERGRYSPRRETGVHQFHRLLARGWNRATTG